MRVDPKTREWIYPDKKAVELLDKLAEILSSQSDKTSLKEKLYLIEDAKSWIENEQALDLMRPVETFYSLKDIYEIYKPNPEGIDDMGRDPEEIFKYLTSNAHLLPLLQQAKPEIRKFFEKNNLVLELSTDPESGYRQIWIHIFWLGTDWEEASKIQDKLDSHLYDMSHELACEIHTMIEYVENEKEEG